MASKVYVPPCIYTTTGPKSLIWKIEELGTEPQTPSLIGRNVPGVIHNGSLTTTNVSNIFCIPTDENSLAYSPATANILCTAKAMGHIKKRGSLLLINCRIKISVETFQYFHNFSLWNISRFLNFIYTGLSL